jgi:uncharacterized protein (DUF488 family)
VAALTVWTVGHSTHPVDELIELLRAEQIDVLADVRSQPYSRYNPQFRRENLKGSLEDGGIRYVFLGAELGGRPPEPEFRDGRGHIRYDLVRASERFRGGLERLLGGAASYRVAIMCSEEDPVRCHRRLLITPALVELEVEVRHIRGDGRVVLESELDGGGEQDALFG